MSWPAEVVIQPEPGRSAGKQLGQGRLKGGRVGGWPSQRARTIFIASDAMSLLFYK